MLPGEVPWPGLIPTDPAVSPLGRTEGPYIYQGYSGVTIGVSVTIGVRRHRDPSRSGSVAIVEGFARPAEPASRGPGRRAHPHGYDGRSRVCAMTTTYAALLRGINVGGKKKVPMAELRQLMEGLGHDAVRTHLQSGQAVFASGHGDEESLADELTQAIEKRFGFSVDVIVRDHAYLRAIVEDCPFPAADVEAKQLHVTYFSGPVDADRFRDLDRQAFLPEEFRLGDRALYLYVPDGLGRSKLAEYLARPRLNKGLIATTRNWNTVTKLADLTAP